MAKKKEALSPAQRLQEALVPSTEWPYQVPEKTGAGHTFQKYQ